MAKVIRVRPYRVIYGVGAGAGAALVMLIAMALLRFGLNFPTIAELMLTAILRAMGGEAFSSALDNLYEAGRPLLFTTILEGTLVLGVLLGLLYAWLARPNPRTGSRPRIFDNGLAGVIYGLLVGLLLNMVFLPIIDQPVFADKPYGIYAESPIPLWAGLMLLALVFGVTLNWLLPKPPALPATTPAAVDAEGVPAPVPEPRVVVESPESADRRSFLRIATGTLAAVIGGALFAYGGTVLNQGGFTSQARRNAADTSGNASSGAGQGADGSASTAPTGTPEAAGALPTDESTQAPATGTPEVAQAQATDMPGAAQAQPTQPPSNTPEQPATATTQTSPTAPVPAINVKEVTPVDSFYHVSKNFFDPSPSADGWKLEIKGMVKNPYSLTYKQLTALPAITVTTGMMCISNPIGGGLAGNQMWKGVKMGDLLKKANPQPGVTEVVMRAVDDYSDSIAYQKALDPDVMLVWEMGGAPLTSLHGFPARVLVPGIYGMKHVKWITSIELVDYDFKGFWQDPSQGWSDPAPVNTMSRIDFPTTGTLDANKPQSISGVAFAGDRSISKVEVSTDGGKTWNQAYIRPPKSQTSWVVWGYLWTPPSAGKYTVQVRATDGDGNLQTSKRADPYPDGATGYHSVAFNVRG